MRKNEYEKKEEGTAGAVLFLWGKYFGEREKRG